MANKKSRTCGRKLSLVLTAIAVSFILAISLLVVLELGLRLSGLNDDYRKKAHETRFSATSEQDEYRFFKLRKNLDVQSKFGYRLRTNSLGIRSPEVSAEPAEGTWRAICVGDSVTFGWGVRAEEAFPQLVEPSLKQHYPNKTIEILNAGNPAYSSYQGLMYLQREIIDLKPDLIVFCFGHNDFFMGPMNDQEQVAFNRKVTTRLKNSLSSLEVVILLKRIISRKKTTTEKRMIPLDTFKRRNDAAQYRRNLEAAAETCRSHNITLILMTQATRGRHKQGRAAYNEAVRAVAHSNNTLLVDPDQVLTGTSHFVDAGHPDANGHRLIADLLYRTIIQSNLVD